VGLSRYKLWKEWEFSEQRKGGIHESSNDDKETRGERKKVEQNAISSTTKFTPSWQPTSKNTVSFTAAGQGAYIYKAIVRNQKKKGKVCVGTH
jgi:hypothetical protein